MNKNQLISPFRDKALSGFKPLQGYNPFHPQKEYLPRKKRIKTPVINIKCQKID